jgi:DNA topoisomerase I
MAKESIHVPEVVTDPVEVAKEAGLRYTTDVKPGIIRKKAGKGFYYLDPHGKRVTEEKVLNRIKSLVIPPAWEDVWICTLENGHLQATGKDARGRKQYRYHHKWREVRDATKYDRMISFGQALPHIRRKTDEHLRLPGLPREKVLATVVKLLEKTLIRIGNEEYARDNNSFGLTTMRDKHVSVLGKEISFEFKGKSGVHHYISIENKHLARIVKKCQDLPGFELFQYIDESGEKRDVKSEDVNAYLKEISGADFTAKDFRTWHGTLLAAEALREFSDFTSQTEAKKNVVKVVEAVSKQLGNTKAVCRKCYIHPIIINTYLEGSLPVSLTEIESHIEKHMTQLKKDEATVILFLQQKSIANHA